MMSTDKELFLHLSDLEDELVLWRKELEYHECFLSWMDLWDEFIYFRKIGNGYKRSPFQI